MKHYLTNALRALEARRSGDQQWSRLEREITGRPSPAERLDLGSLPDHHPEDTSEMRRYLAAQTSQTV
jgi:hypothetical protein